MNRTLLSASITATFIALAVADALAQEGLKDNLPHPDTFELIWSFDSGG